jgi:hypothetical protein
MLMYIVVSAVMTTFCMVIRRVYLHDVSLMQLYAENACQEEEEPSPHHVAPEMSLPHEPSHIEHSVTSLTCAKHACGMPTPYSFAPDLMDRLSFDNRESELLHDSTHSRCFDDNANISRIDIM